MVVGKRPISWLVVVKKWEQGASVEAHQSQYIRLQHGVV